MARRGKFFLFYFVLEFQYINELICDFSYKIQPNSQPFMGKFAAMLFENTLAFAQSLDNSDNLAHLRSEFIIPTNKDGEPIVYLLRQFFGFTT